VFSTPILEFAYVLIASIVHEGTHFLVFLFLSSYIVFWHFFTKLESTTVIYPRAPYSGQSLNGKGGFDF
jgi:hypothetical protein